MNRFIEGSSELIKGLNSLISSLTLGKFLKWIITVSFLVIIILFVYENFFNPTFLYNKMNNNLDIIERVQKLSNNDSLINIVTKEKLIETIESLNIDKSEINKSVKQLNIFNLDSNITYLIFKILAVLILPIFIIIIGIKNSNNNKKDTIIGGVFVIIISLLICFFVPKIDNQIWFSILITPTIQILVMIGYMIFKKNN
ncbi:MAG: hypothetical protein AB8B78_11875 [Polaribacter sp.]